MEDREMTKVMRWIYKHIAALDAIAYSKTHKKSLPEYSLLKNI